VRRDPPPELLRRLWLASPVRLRRWLVARLEARFTVAVTVVLQDCEEQVLLLRHRWHAHGGWGLPGGFLLRGEEPEAGVVRELREETGLSCKDLCLLQAGSVAGGQGVELLFRARLYEPQPLRLNWEILEGRWFAREALPSELPGPQRRMLESLL